MCFRSYSDLSSFSNTIEFSRDWILNDRETEIYRLVVVSSKKRCVTKFYIPYNCSVTAKFVTDQFFPLSPVTTPEVFAKVKSAQFLARV